MDQRNQALAHKLVNYSCKLTPDERVWIETTGAGGLCLTELVVKEVYKAGGLPFVNTVHERVQRDWLIGASEKQIRLLAKYDAYKMKDMQAYIGIRSMGNTAEYSDVPDIKRDMYNKFYNKPINIDIRVPKTKWVVLSYPTAACAQEAGMSTEAYEDFYYNVCNMDYGKMSRAMDALVNIMEETDTVHIKGADTDISFSVKGVPAIKCDGTNNIPDGEVFTAPVKTSVNGHIAFNAPSNFQGFTFENIRLEFKRGKVVKATANNSGMLNKILDTDPGSRYTGEFSLGVNPYITRPAKNTLFDEKIAGSFHLTPGACYNDAPNGNKSAIHWDMVCIQTEAYGGGDIYFDGRLIRRDGLFVVPELEGLNPEALK